MSGSTLRRTVLCFVVVTLLLPLANAWAAPAREAGLIQLPEWSRILLAPLSGMMDLLRSACEENDMPPGQKPGNDGTTRKNREGNGFDPHGKP